MTEPTIIYSTERPRLYHVKRNDSDELKSVVAGSYFKGGRGPDLWGANKWDLETPPIVYTGPADAWEVEGYAVRFTGPDHTDSNGGYFTAETDLRFDRYVRRGAMAILFEHGQSSETFDDPIAALKEARLDDNGLWLKVQLDRACAYADSLRRLAWAGCLGFSTGAIIHLRKFVEMPNGKTWQAVWPAAECSLVKDPAAGYLTVVRLSPVQGV